MRLQHYYRRRPGKHVYVEKPCSHNPAEGELLVKAAGIYGKVIQMGNQRRSYPNVIKAIQELKDGTIGRAYLGKGWYTNNRDTIGIGKEIAVPEGLNWDLWQGPAPTAGLQRQHRPLQLALALALGNWRGT